MKCMNAEIKFNVLQNEKIFTDDFKKLTKNNSVKFSKEGIAIIYGPNGTGKTTLMRILAEDKNTKYEFKYKENTYQTGNEQIYFLINDQNSRSNIRGTANEFFLGDNIDEEFKLKKFVSKEYGEICKNLIEALKIKFNISTKTNKLLHLIDNKDIHEIIMDLVNKTSKGKSITVKKFTDVILAVEPYEIEGYDQKKYKFAIEDLSDTNSLINQILALAQNKLTKNEKIVEIEENNEAIHILHKFHDMQQCIVCDNTMIDVDELLEHKESNKESIVSSLDEHIKKIVEKIAQNIDYDNPFKIKENLLKAISDGNVKLLIDLQNELKLYKEICKKEICNVLLKVLMDSDLVIENDKLEELRSKQIEINEEDLSFIKEVVNNSIDKVLDINRDSENNIKIYISDKELLETDREELPLSAGEQNFLSLTFEFLKAKKSGKEIIIVDDPVSSFDSIYKNKIAFSIIKMLEKQNKIILTHNLDLVRLLNSQYKGCYNLYILNNTDGEENGFIHVNNGEQKLLINISELIQGIRGDILKNVINPKLFLMAMIPFMRGYSELIYMDVKKFPKNGETISTNEEVSWTEQLTNVMHGYKNEKVDIALAYRNLFQISPMCQTLPDLYSIDVNDILSIEFNTETIIVDSEKYGLFDKTLHHSLNYLYLRLKVEQVLVGKYNINVGVYKQLGQIISQAFPENDVDSVKKRVFLTSKKTLLNEFNHFEGNMNIFQPAIDITDSALKRV